MGGSLELFEFVEETFDHLGGHGPVQLTPCLSFSNDVQRMHEANG